MASSSGVDGTEIDDVMEQNAEIDRTVPEPKEAKPQRGPLNLPALPSFNIPSFDMAASNRRLESDFEKHNKQLNVRL